MPTFGRPAYLREAIESVLVQTVADFEVVVVDDASPEPVTLPDHPKIRLIRLKQNSGPGPARNAGIDAARGRYVTFLDDDDLYTPDRLQLALDGVATASVSVCWSQYLGEQARPQRMLNGRVHDQIVDTTAPALGVTAVERLHLHRFDPSFKTGEDVDWWMRTTKDHEIATVPRVGYLVRRHDGDRGEVGTEQRIRDGHRLLDVHHDYYLAHRRARAFRWKRIGLMSLSVGDRTTARRAFLRALRTQPNLADARHLWRASRAGSQ